MNNLQEFDNQNNKEKNTFSLSYLLTFGYLGFFIVGMLIATLFESLNIVIFKTHFPLLSKFISLFINVIPLVFPVAIAFMQAQKENKTIDLNWKPTYYLLPLLLIITVAMTLFCSYTTEFIPNDTGILKKWYKVFEEAFEELAHPQWILVIATCVLAPVCEELFFRGLILNGLLKKAKTSLQVWGAILFTALLFGLIHMNPWQFIAAMIAGTVMGYVYYGTQSLTNTILMHALNNIISVVVLLYYGKDEPSELLNYPEWWNLIFLAIIIVGLLGVKRWGRINTNSQEL